eukprot:CAMPEP_0117622524 /NCGR_PEP_ID=MMETSP0784-20121206/88184_1 /TAXON_ID=39447 /ORGANISM="" /LENGTH=238 /DNA_ID=CAMNT_0005426463 /DNA_START=1 /DNA_END=714 /DNA_ORIENTATION=-
MRTAYECAPKQYRAQFITALSRAAWIEEASGELSRENWRDVFKTFPEIQTWRLFEAQLRERTWDDGAKPLQQRVSRRRSPSRDRSRSPRRASNGDASALKWVFVPGADILLTIGEGMVGISYEGAYIIDPRKKRAGGVWVGVQLPPGVLLDPEVKALVDEFEIDDVRAVTTLIQHCSQRPNTKLKDLEELRKSLFGSRNPTGVLISKLKEMMTRTTSGGKGKKGKGKAAALMAEMGHY